LQCNLFDTGRVGLSVLITQKSDHYMH